MSGAGSDASSLELVTFDGSGDVTVFLQNVMRVALVQGRQRDDDWMVSYAEASLTGDALRWFVGLNEVSLRSWRSVRNAFLARFTAPAARVTVSKHPLPSEVSQSSVQGGNVYKTLVVGKSGCGKSCLLSRYLGYGWARQMTPTEGVAYEMYAANYSGTVYDNHIWDASGTMPCETLALQYTTALDRLWIVYDVTDKSSFDSIRTWHMGICKNKSLTVHLIGTKIDLVGRAISTQQGQALATELGIGFSETSSKTNEGIQNLWRWLPHFMPFK